MLDDIPALFLNEVETRRVQQGQKIQLNSLQYIKEFELKHPNYNEFDQIWAIKDENLIALIKIKDGIMRPSRVINF